MIALALLLSLVAQDTTGLSPRARAMLGHFPPPPGGKVSVATRFSADTVWVGEQVELVTAAWFPLELRDRLRHSPSLQAPTLSGLWSAKTQATPMLATRRTVGRRVYDLFVAHQTIFPLAPGEVSAPPAVLTYGVPASSSFFAPEERKTLRSRVARLLVRAIPPSLAARLGNGPTARTLRLTWRSAGGRLVAGAPTAVQLVVSGEGNLTLWPEPEVTWPNGVHVYPDPSEEHLRPIAGRIAGEKVFHYTIVAESAGVITLPSVRYPYFDPTTVQVSVAASTPMSLAVAAAARADQPDQLPIGGRTIVPIASRLVAAAGASLWALLLLPPLLAWWWRRRRPAAPRRAIVVDRDDPETILRRLLREPGDAGPERMAGSLRRHGVPREEADQLRRWLIASSRRRYGPGGGTLPEPPSVMARVLRLLRVTSMPVLFCFGVLRMVSAQSADPVTRYQAGDFPGAAHGFERAVAAEPLAVDRWRDLGSARWMNGDEVGAAAAWLHALSLAPREPTLRAVWRRADEIPGDVRRLGPTVPVSLDEVVVAGVVLWLAGWAAVALRRRRAGWILLGAAAAALLVAGWRWRQFSAGDALVRHQIGLLVSPYATAQPLSPVAPWTRAHIERRQGVWSLIALNDGRRGWVETAELALISPLH